MPRCASAQSLSAQAKAKDEAHDKPGAQKGEGMGGAGAFWASADATNKEAAHINSGMTLSKNPNFSINPRIPSAAAKW